MDGLALALNHAETPGMAQDSWEWIINREGMSFEVLTERHLLARDSHAGNSSQLAA
jgi:hypothetical protein